MTVILACTALVVAAATSAAAPSDKNSVALGFRMLEQTSARGVGCGASASAVFQLPAEATDGRVVLPKVGDRDQQGTAIVTAATVVGTTVTLTVTGDGPRACDQEDYGDGSGDPLDWSSYWEVDVSYKQRLATKARRHFHLFGAKLATKPRKIWLGPPDTPRGFRLQVHKIKWHQFGGSKAIGNGRRLEDCPRKGACPKNNRRMRIELSAPRYCPALKAAVYTKLQTFLRGRRFDGMKQGC